jgi:hypothetical protein
MPTALAATDKEFRKSAIESPEMIILNFLLFCVQRPLALTPCFQFSRRLVRVAGLEGESVALITKDFCLGRR